MAQFGIRVLGLSQGSTERGSCDAGAEGISRTFPTGFQYESVASIATAWQPAVVSQSRNAVSSGVVVLSRCSGRWRPSTGRMRSGISGVPCRGSRSPSTWRTAKPGSGPCCPRRTKAVSPPFRRWRTPRPEPDGCRHPQRRTSRFGNSWTPNAVYCESNRAGNYTWSCASPHRDTAPDEPDRCHHHHDSPHDWRKTGGQVHVRKQNVHEIQEA